MGIASNHGMGAGVWEYYTTHLRTNLNQGYAVWIRIPSEAYFFSHVGLLMLESISPTFVSPRVPPL
jgi:hypothetical protein